MKKVIGGLVAVAGLAAAAYGQAANTRLVYEVSSDGGNTWTSSVNVLPGTQIQVRALVSYIGTTGGNGGLGQIVFQPVVSSWTGADSLITQDIDGAGPSTSQGIGPVGGSRSTPVGIVPDAPGVFGRVSPFGANATSTSTFLRGHLGTGTAAGLLRIAQNQITNWIGVGATSGAAAANNWNGGGGVSIAQIADPSRLGTDPAYNANRSDVVVFKFGFNLSSATDLRSLGISTPADGIGKVTTAGTAYGQQNCRWYPTQGSTQATDVGGCVIEGATVNVVPTPASLALLGLGGLVAARRRR
jgi:hypothetical protein